MPGKRYLALCLVKTYVLKNAEAGNKIWVLPRERLAKETTIMEIDYLFKQVI